MRKRKSFSHKGQNGKVLIIGGSMEFPGATILAGIAAYRSGADYVAIAAPEKIALAINAWPDLITIKLKGKRLQQNHFAKLLKISKNYDCMLIGNGIGIDASTKKLCRKLTKIKMPKVIDADAIKAIGLKDAINCVITPHKKEFEILLKNGKTKNIGQAQKQIGKNVIILKGKTDLIITSGKILKNKTGNPGMTKAGTGDVLAGICAGLIAQGNSLLESAVYAAYINGKAGENLYRKHGYGYTATELAIEAGRLLKGKI